MQMNIVHLEPALPEPLGKPRNALAGGPDSLSRLNIAPALADKDTHPLLVTRLAGSVKVHNTH